MTAQNLIEILQACAHNTDISLDKLEVKIIDYNGYLLDINGYQVEQIIGTHGDYVVLLEA